VKVLAQARGRHDGGPIEIVLHRRTETLIDVELVDALHVHGDQNAWLELESGVARVFAGELEPVELTTLEVETAGKRHVAVNDAVVTSGELGRMVELEWSIGGEDFGRVPCDGLICSTPSGSTAYNLSNGGPVLVRGLDALAVTFIAPHSLDARPLVVPRGLTVTVANRTADVPCAVLVDGHRVGEIAPSGEIAICLCTQRSLLATLPETTFFARYRATFS